MQVLFIIPNDFSCNNYSKIEQIREIRPLRLVYYETILENLCKGIIKLQKEVQKSHSSKSFLNNFTWNKGRFSSESFDQLITDIQNQLERCQKIFKSVENENKDIFFSFYKEESFEFIDLIHCIVNSNDYKRFENLFPGKTIEKLKTIDNKSLYVIYCLKSEREKTREFLKKNNFTLYIPRKYKYSEDENRNKDIEVLPLNELIIEIQELLIIAYTAKGLTEALNKYSISCGYKYKIVPKDIEDTEYDKIRKENKIPNIEDAITRVFLDL